MSHVHSNMFMPIWRQMHSTSHFMGLCNYDTSCLAMFTESCQSSAGLDKVARQQHDSGKGIMVLISTATLLTHPCWQVIRWLGLRGAAVQKLDIRGPQSKCQAWQHAVRATLMLMPNLRNMTIRGCPGILAAASHPQLSFMRGMTKLQSLHLLLNGHEGCPAVELETVPQFTALTHLHVRVSWMCSPPLKIPPAWAQLTGLQELHLECNSLSSPEYIGDDDLLPLLGKLTALKCLTLIGVVNRVPNELVLLPALRQLHVECLPSNGIGPTFPALLWQCSKLEHIGLAHISSRFESWHESCSTLAQLPALRSLYLQALTSMICPQTTGRSSLVSLVWCFKTQA